MGLIKNNGESYSQAEGRKITEEHGLAFVPDISPLAQNVGHNERPDNSTHHFENRKVSNFEDAKSHRILIQGILQAVIQSQGLLLEPGDYIQKVKDTTLDLVKFVEKNTK